MTRDTTPPAADLVDRVRAAAGGVPDPELPPVSLGMLGMVHDVVVTPDRTAVVTLLPTWAGCPAREMMGRDVTAAVAAVDGIGEVEVRWSLDPVWTPDRIDAEGREALASFGIAPPPSPIAGTETPHPVQGRGALPVVAAARPCPYCGSSDTRLDSAFGPTPCRDVRFCNACTQPFEAFKPH